MVDGSRSRGAPGDPYDAGFSAWLAGVAKAGNPYPSDSAEHEDWRCGFDDASCEHDDETADADPAAIRGRGVA